MCLIVSQPRLDPLLFLSFYFFFLSKMIPAHQECNFRITVISPAPGDRRASLSAGVCCLAPVFFSFWELVTRRQRRPRSLCDASRHETQPFLICQGSSQRRCPPAPSSSSLKAFLSAETASYQKLVGVFSRFLSRKTEKRAAGWSFCSALSLLAVDRTDISSSEAGLTAEHREKVLLGGVYRAIFTPEIFL